MDGSGRRAPGGGLTGLGAVSDANGDGDGAGGATTIGGGFCGACAGEAIGQSNVLPVKR
jgi:hypothetical protein